MSEVDYSDEAITRRLQEAGELYRLCVSLGLSKPTSGERTSRPPSSGILPDDHEKE